MENTSDILFLAGMPGSGKSYWAQQLAKEYGLEVHDTDHIIESEEQTFIPEIFDKRGEDYFRKKEHEVIMQIIAANRKKSVVSLGGGAPCYHDNMQLMKEAGTVIYLKAAIDTLFDQIRNEISDRPLLQEHADDLRKRLQTLLDARKHFYEQAHYIFEVEDLSLPKFAAILKHHE